MSSAARLAEASVLLVVVCGSACRSQPGVVDAGQESAASSMQELVWQLEDRPDDFARLDGRWCRTDADCQHPALRCVQYSEQATSGSLSQCHVDCTSLKCPRGTWCGSFTHGPLRRICIAPRTRSRELGIDAGDVRLISQLARSDAGHGRWAAVAMNLDLGRDAAVLTALGGTTLHEVVVRCAVDDALLDGVAYGSGVVVEGTRSDGGIECRAIATGRRHLAPLCRAPGARDLLECRLLLDD